MERTLKISVITPSFNSGKQIQRAIDSVLDQQYSDFEHIIIDGGSTDETLNILKSYNHLRWVSEKDNGQSHAMNKGFRMSSGQIIVYLNADDSFERGVFKLVEEKFHTTQFKIVIGNTRIIYEEDKRVEIRKPSVKYSEIIKYWNNRFPPNPVSYFYLREVQIGYLFPEDNHTTMDLEFLFYATRYFSSTYLNKVFGSFYINGSNKTSFMNILEEQAKAYVSHCSQHNRYLYYKYLIGKIIRKWLK